MPSAEAPNDQVEAASHLARLGDRSRPTGSDAADQARRYCAGVLRSHGFSVGEQEFEYSQFPGRWATPAAGFFIPAAATLVVALRARVDWWPAAAVVLAIAAAWIGRSVARRGVLNLAWARAQGMNLEARRGADPEIWLVAHIDSKWQPVSMLLRVVGVLVVCVSVVGLVVALAGAPERIADFLASLWIGALPLMLSVVGSRNHGSLDNASGVATVLHAVGMLPASTPLGVLITDAEELALAGAAAWARGRTPAVAFNCDSIDDDGALVVMYTGAVPRALVSSLERSALASGEPIRTLRLIPGILTDSVALAKAGWQTVTLSRGTLRTLGRIHTSRDSLATMDGRGIPGAARVLARAVTELG